MVLFKADGPRAMPRKCRILPSVDFAASGRVPSQLREVVNGVLYVFGHQLPIVSNPEAPAARALRSTIISICRRLAVRSVLPRGFAGAINGAINVHSAGCATGCRHNVCGSVASTTPRIRRPFVNHNRFNGFTIFPGRH
jgi:hypothetical protein